MIFKRLALAISFSPNSKNLLLEAIRLKKLFGAKLFLIHIGEDSIENQNKMNQLISECSLSDEDYELNWRKGDVEDLIMDFCTEKQIDLLIAGALIKENVIKYYIGSVARKLMREAPCSVLLLTKGKDINKSFKKICVSVDFSQLSENAVKVAYEFAKLEESENLTLVREFQLPGLSSTIYEEENKEDLQKQKHDLLDEEKEKMKIFIKELNLNDVNVNYECLYGKQGWEASNWVAENHFDLFVISTPQRRPKLIDRIFQHDFEFVFKELPSSLLIVKTELQ